ncbi:MAG: hypothetical protein BAJALOKI1v1_630002 [Promethearchaeota archaeon]|nr:MAG: hypothetical protein BAJALOKI1v1_630002 [Candidatus Lokiarchaeota archaeon]
MSFRIISDLSHNEQAEFPEFSLKEDIYEIDYIEKNEGPIDFDSLESYDVLFIGDIQHSEDEEEDKFTRKELKAIKRFIGEGGGLLLTSSPGGDRDIPMKQGSIRVLYNITGVTRYWNGLVLESKTNFLVKKYNLLFNELPSHPITKKVGEIVMPNSTFFSTIEEGIEEIITTSGKTRFKYYRDEVKDQVGPVPVAVANEFYNGRAITIGSSDFMLEDEDFGLDAGDNLIFFENIIKWLCFEI